MASKKFTNEFIKDIIDDAECVDEYGSKYGTMLTYVFKHEDKHWMFSIEHILADGLQFYDSEVECEEVVQEVVTTTVWAPV